MVSHDLDLIGTNMWWMKQVQGATILDKLLLFILKIVYLGLRVSLRVLLGRQKRNTFCTKRDILYFKDFLYKSIEFLRLVNFFLLKINVPTYNYKVYCRLNKEDFVILTKHEDEIIEHFSPKEGDIVIDVGAHIGRYTIIASKRVGVYGKVIAIEAHPGNYDMLNRNIKLNGLTNVITLNYAVYSKESKIKLYVPDEEFGYTMHHSIMFNYLSSKYPLLGKENEKFIEVNASTLDNLLQKNGLSREVNWIKIDVEGAEFEVLTGSIDILSKSKDISLLIEVHNVHAHHHRVIIELLSSYNFKVEFQKSYNSVEKHIILRKSV